MNPDNIAGQIMEIKYAIIFTGVLVSLPYLKKAILKIIELIKKTK